MGNYGIKTMAFLMRILAVTITWILGTKIAKEMNSFFSLIIGGMLVGSLFQSFISLAKYTADSEDKLPEITFWLMGSLSKANERDLFMFIIPYILCMIIVVFQSQNINIISLREEEAQTLGVDIKKVQFIVIGVVSILTAFSVSISGMIGWIGLIIPHFTRMLIGSNFKYLIPASILLGANYLLIMDNISRTLLSVEIPLGILTSLAGIPFFIYFLTKGSR